MTGSSKLGLLLQLLPDAIEQRSRHAMRQLVHRAHHGVPFLRAERDGQWLVRADRLHVHALLSSV
jgi:hypothetical protein